MTLLNLQGFQPAMLFSLARAVDVLGETTEDSLARWVSPATYGLTNDAPSAKTTFDDVLDTAVLLGIVEKSADGSIRASRVGTLESFKRELRERVLASDQNAALADGARAARGSGASELTWALTWLMRVPATTGPYSYRNAESLFNRQDIRPRPVTNDTRWPKLVAWSVFLGFGWTTSLGGGDLRLVPDPTRAVFDSLEGVFGHDATLDAPNFVARLAAILPVLDGGAYRAILDQMDEGNPGEGSERELSEPLSLALLRLRDRGVIELGRKADSHAFIARLGALRQHFQQVSLVGAAAKRKKGRAG